MIMSDILSDMTTRIINNFKPSQIILFGSHARGNAHQYSDIDLLVVLPVVDNKRKAAIEIRRLLADLPVSKDIIVTTQEEINKRGNIIGSVLKSAIKEGKVIYEKG